jgi:hypothetical protein
VRRDALQHLPCELVVASLQNFARSKPRFLLVGSYNGDSRTNHNIAPGDYFLINLREAPYSLGKGVLQVGAAYKSLGDYM